MGSVDMLPNTSSRSISDEVVGREDSRPGQSKGEEVELARRDQGQDGTRYHCKQCSVAENIDISLLFASF